MRGTSQLENFFYLVRVQEENVNKSVENAKVTIEVSGEPPLDEISDSNGIARIFVSESYSQRPGRLLVEAPGYEPYRYTNPQKLDHELR